MEINQFMNLGLSNDEVSLRINKKQVNDSNLQKTKSYKRIFLTNSITFFNLINIILFISILFVKSYQNGLFIGIIFFNTSISIFQELKAKRILDSLTILNETTVEVIRNNQIHNIRSNEIVLDDIILLKNGQQIPTDCILLNGTIDVNESLLTGESDLVHKGLNDILLSGSFITSGQAVCKVTHVGSQNYSEQILNEVKNEDHYTTQLQGSLDKILKIVSILIIPIAVLLVIKQYFFLKISFDETIIVTVAAILGMIPEGLILLTSIALTVSIITLAKQSVLVQDLFCIETLARIDTLCLDKTGTITTGNMFVDQYIEMDTSFIPSIEKVVSNMAQDNQTAKALVSYFNHSSTKALHSLPFSSERKYSAYRFEKDGTYFIGAAQFLFNKQDPILKQTTAYAKQGYRVLVLAKSNTTNQDYSLVNIKPLGIVLLQDELRNNAADTIEYFNKQGVCTYIISGDDPNTVGSIAMKVGFKTVSTVDASTISSNEELTKALHVHNVFGRVTPKQKQQIITHLQQSNKIVAMTGDGVNDVLALSKADCSISFATASDACKKTAKIILLNDDFATLPSIVNEGRRVINNITSCATMYLIKNIFSVILSVSTLLFSAAYPFEPLQLTIISCFGVGIPTFFLTYEDNFNPVKNNFVKEVFIKSLPTAILIAVTSSFIVNIGLYFGYNAQTLNTMCFIFASCNYTFALTYTFPLTTKYRKSVFAFVVFGLLTTILLLRNVIELVILPFNLVIIIGILTLLSPLLQKNIQNIILYLYQQYKNT